MLHQNSPPSNSIIVDFDIRLILVSDNFCICFLKGQFCFSFACLIIIKIWVLEITHKNRRFVSFLLIVQCEETKREMVYYYMTIPSLKAWARLITCWCSIIKSKFGRVKIIFQFGTSWTKDNRSSTITISKLLWIYSLF